MRLSADSPLIDKNIILRLKNFNDKNMILYKCMPEIFSKGQSVEILCGKSFKENFKFSEKKDLEHVTSFFIETKQSLK